MVYIGVPFNLFCDINASEWPPVKPFSRSMHPGFLGGPELSWESSLMDCKTQPIEVHELSDQRKVRQRCPSQDHVGQKWTKADMAQSEAFDFGAEKGTLTPVGGSATDLH